MLEPERLKRFFEAFYSTKPTGMGIGFSICRSIIEAHEGRIWATANDPCGVTLHVSLPGSRFAITPIVMSAVPNHSESSCGSASEAYRVAWASSAEIPKCANTIPNAINAMSVRIGEEPEQPVKLPHLRNLGSPAYLELSGTMVGRAGLNLWRGSRF
jgi:hypothetical protein